MGFPTFRLLLYFTLGSYSFLLRRHSFVQSLHAGLALVLYGSLKAASTLNSPGKLFEKEREREGHRGRARER